MMTMRQTNPQRIPPTLLPILGCLFLSLVWTTPCQAAFGPGNQAVAFAAALSQQQQRTTRLAASKDHPPNDNDVLDNPQRPDDSPTTVGVSSSRRALLRHTLLAVLTTSSTPANAANDNNALFRPNPLTNPLLEQVRIWEQAEADERKYGGELQRGDAPTSEDDYYPRLLVPILDIANDLEQVQRLVGPTQEPREQSLQRAQQILNQGKFDKVAFKKAFNAFGDNIYYSDPDRANLYLGGGATPKNSQSLAYLLRNEVLTNVEDMRAEVGYLLKESNANNNNLDLGDLMQMAKAAQKAMTEYLAVVPPAEIQRAKTIMATTT